MITITYHSDNEDMKIPLVNLGGTNPWIARSILAIAVNTLDYVIPSPTIVYDSDILYSEEDDGFLIDPDSDDEW